MSDYQPPPEPMPCPWCQHPATIDNYKDFSSGGATMQVKCTNSACGVAGPKRPMREDALTAWSFLNLAVGSVSHGQE